MTPSAMTGGVSDQPKISIVVPVFNGAALLGECLASIDAAVDNLAAEDRQRIEVIVCDNHSTDGCEGIARAMSPDCSYRVVQPPAHEENRTRNWAYGLGVANGEWRMMLHHDDRLALHGLQHQLNAASSPSASRAVLIVGRHRTFADHARPSALRPRLSPWALVPGPVVAREVLPLHCPFVPFTLFRATTYDAVGGLDARWQLVQDWELWLRLLQRGDLLTHPGEVGWWRVHSSGDAYKALNAREHVALAIEMRSTVPGLRPGTARAASSVAAAKARIHLSGRSQESPPPELSTTLPTDEEAARTVSQAAFRVAMMLGVVRSLGALRIRLRHIVTRRKAMTVDVR